MTDINKYRLLCVIDNEPQVLTRVFHELVTDYAQSKKITEVHLIVTGEGKKRVEAALLSKNGQWWRCLNSLGLKRNSVKLLPSFITELKHADGSLPEDVLTKEHGDHAAGLVLQKIETLTRDDQGLHVCVSDGRHHLAMYVAQALSLLGRAKDELTNLVVTKAVAQSREFFFPDLTQPPVQIDEGDFFIEHSDIEIYLCDVAFVRLRALLPQNTIDSIVKGFSLMHLASEAQTTLSTIRIQLYPDECRVLVNGKDLDLEPKPRAFLYWLAERRMQLDEHWVNPDTDISRFVDIYLTQNRSRQSTVNIAKSFEMDELSHMMSRILKSLKRDLGSKGLESIGVLREKQRGHTNYGLYSVKPELVSAHQN